MVAPRLSAKARTDLAGVVEYTLRTWGVAQTNRYLKRIEDSIEQLAAKPMLGRRCDGILPGLRRIAEGRHVIFYKITKGGVFIHRILHESMLPQGRIH